jgi:hypothetical protein
LSEPIVFIRDRQLKTPSASKDDTDLTTFYNKLEAAKVKFLPAD